MQRRMGTRATSRQGGRAAWLGLLAALHVVACGGDSDGGPTADAGTTTDVAVNVDGTASSGADGGLLPDAAVGTDVTAGPDAARLPPGSPGSVLVRVRATMSAPCTGAVLEPTNELFGCSATAAYDEKAKTTVLTVADATRVIAAVYVAGPLVNGSYDAKNAMGFGVLIRDKKRYNLELFVIDVANVTERTAASMPDQKAYDFAFDLHARYAPTP